MYWCNHSIFYLFYFIFFNCCLSWNQNFQSSVNWVLVQFHKHILIYPDFFTVFEFSVHHFMTIFQSFKTFCQVTTTTSEMLHLYRNNWLLRGFRIYKTQCWKTLQIKDYKWELLQHELFTCRVNSFNFIRTSYKQNWCIIS